MLLPACVGTHIIQTRLQNTIAKEKEFTMRARRLTALTGTCVSFALLLCACNTISPTDISTTGTLAGSNGNVDLTMAHDGAAEGAPQIVVASPTGTGDLNRLSIEIARQGAAPAVGYELLTVVNEFTVAGGGGLVRQGVAGNIGFHRQNTGKLAKVSYYWYEDSGESAAFSLPAGQGGFFRVPGNAWLARVRSNDEQVRVPFTDTSAAAGNFLTAACLTGGDDPCFDMATLAGALFANFSASFTGFANADPLVSLGGPAGDGNFRLDYIPSIPLRSGPCNNPRIIPGFGFVFTGTVTYGAILAAFDISLPILFAIDTIPAPGGITEFATFVLPFDAVGTCHEFQSVGPIVVRASTPLGIGATEAANAIRTGLACNLFGTGLATITSCPANTPAGGSTPPLVTAGLAAMVSNTLNFHHRTTRGGTVTPAADVYVRTRNADNAITTTRVAPATASDCPNAISTAPGRPPMCMIDLLVLE
jgi:hypothetical protein